jgi:DnaJ-class molecular chaperone
MKQVSINRQQSYKVRYTKPPHKVCHVCHGYGLRFMKKGKFTFEVCRFCNGHGTMFVSYDNKIFAY